ncbi:karst [Carabus blaptoides fortunei]
MMEEERMHLQKKLFTKWMNSSLKKASMEVEDLYTDLADGKKLLKLLEIISGEKLGKPNNGIMRVHKLENVNKSLAFLHTKVHLESIGAADIVDGNPRLILGLIWTIILYFGIQEIEIDVNEDNESSEKKSAKDALLLWCQRNTQGYPNVHITDFTSSWRSGLGFNALIHSHRPDLIQWQNLTPSKHLDNLNHAFDVANDELGIPRLLDAEDVDTSRPDEISIITYLASYYHTFARMKNEMKSERRIDNLVQDIERAWISLEKEEHEREVALRRQEPLAELNYKFEQESVLREGHLKEMIPVLSDPGYGSNLSQADATVKKHEAISADTMARTLHKHPSGNMASSSSQQAEKIEIVSTELVKNATFDTSANMATSAGSRKVDTNISGSYIEHFNQHNHLAPSTSSTQAPRGNPINNVELAVDTFIGRETELSDIKKLFQVYPVVVIAAMGGMGKTQLARKFASVNANVYRDRYWINAETTEQLLKSFDRLAEKVKVKANTDIDTVRDTYRSFTEGAALLILDNVEHVNNVYEYLPTRIQLEDITLHVLVTSRWTEWTSDPLVNCYQLQPLDISVSLQLFRRKFSQTYELRYVDERASAVADYYKNNPSPAILVYLAKNNAIAAMEAVLKLLSKNQAQIEIKEHDLLHGALGNGDFNMARLLCKYGADVNQMFGHGQWAEPPLHDVLQRKNLEIAIWLLENGAMPNLRDGEGLTRSACAAAVSLILRRNNDLINIVNKNGETALHVLPYYDDIDNTYIDDKRIVSTIRVLFQSGADVSKADTLHVAARGACAAAVTLILQRNKDLIDMKNEDGKTALHVLGNNFNKYTSKEIFAAVRKTARVLIVNGLSLDTRDNRGCTPLDTVEPKFRDILRQVSDECNNRVRPVKRQSTE